MLLFIRGFFLLFLFLNAGLSISATKNINANQIEDVETIRGSSFREKENELKNSKEKEKIRALQRRLINEGYYSGPVNGMKTSETRQAIKNWSKDRD